MNKKKFILFTSSHYNLKIKTKLMIEKKVIKSYFAEGHSRTDSYLQIHCNVVLILFLLVKIKKDVSFQKEKKNQTTEKRKFKIKTTSSV